MLRLTKHHGLGNDFLIALEAHNSALTPDADLTRWLCDRHLGVGADGVIFSLSPAEPEHDSCMVLLNADGSEAEISGNGIRCLGQALMRDAGVAEGELDIETPGGVRHLRTVKGDADGEVWIQVDMGPASRGVQLGPKSQDFPAINRATLDIGNPHLVLHVSDVGAIDVAAVGAELESEYPDGMNVHFVQAASDSEILLRVWERGAGVTTACGSGATVAASLAKEWGLVGDHVTVTMPGGSAIVEIAANTLLLTGPATFVGEVAVPW